MNMMLANAVIDVVALKDPRLTIQKAGARGDGFSSWFVEAFGTCSFVCYRVGQKVWSVACNLTLPIGIRP